MTTGSTSPTPHPLVYGKRLDDLDVLARSKLLAGLGIRDIGTFLDLLDQVALPRGTTVFREGDIGELMYFVLEGTGRLSRGKLELRTVGPGDHFGELALLGGGRREMTVDADTTMRLARFSRSRYVALATSHGRLALHFTQALAKALGDEVVAVTDSVGLLAHQRSAPRRLEIRIHRLDEALVVATGTLAGALLPREHDGVSVVGATFNRKAIGLETALSNDGRLEPLTLASAEGREIHARSMALVLLEAARRIAPGLGVRMGSMLENAQVVTISNEIDRARFAAALLDEIRRLVAEDIPLREEVWTVDEARVDLVERGVPEAAALLANRRDSTVTIVRCGETFAIGTGPLLPRASYLGAPAIAPHPEGLMLRFVDHDAQMPLLNGVRVDPAADEANTPRYGGEMAVSSRRWLEGLGVGTVGAFDEHCVRGRVPELIRVAEGFHEKWIGKLADTIASRKSSLRVIAVAGPSSSGKTTFIKRLVVQLLVNGVRPHSLSLDDYFVDRERTIRDEKGDYDFEAIEALDSSLLRDQVGRLLAGDEVTTARYDFVRGESHPTGGKTLALRAGDVLLIEGIHGLDPGLLGGVAAPAEVFRVFVHPARTLPIDRLSVVTPEDVRLLRRIVRDRHHRNRSAAETIMRWGSVRRGDLVHVFPRLPFADAVFDSSLTYELSVIKTFAERYLLEVPATDPALTTAYRLRRLIDTFVAIDPDHVPPTSVIREFIGGSGFEY